MLRLQKEEKDREIWVGKSRIYPGGDNILCLTIFGEVDEEIEIGINEACVKLMNMIEGKVKVLDYRVLRRAQSLLRFSNASACSAVKLNR